MATFGSLSASSSTSSTLWATASKEWVIQPKPKPGRKPKKDTVTASSDDPKEVDTKGRRVQNRAAQRAFRERKQTQLAELQARLHSYEQGEIERNVALQSIAKRLKEENESLRKENLALQAKLDALERARSSDALATVSPMPDKKRWRNHSPTMTSQAPARKKSRTASFSGQSQISTASGTHLASPESMVSTPDPADVESLSSLQFEQHVDVHGALANPLTMLSAAGKSTDPLHHFAAFDCGFCDQNTICVCRAMAAQSAMDQAVTMVNLRTSSALEKPIEADVNAITVLKQEQERDDGPSILDNLPAYKPPVPLRRRANAAVVNSVFPIQAAPRSSEATCSGDPLNCLACADDAFGKAFCAAIGSSSTGRCNGCDGSSGAGCCGGTSNCTSCPPISTTAEFSYDQPGELIPTNDAWRKLKAHPNVDFADLSLLAEVVASRSKCTGPRLVFSPAPQAAPNPNSAIGRFMEGKTIDNPPRFSDSSPPPQLVPQEILLECGRRRLRQVHAAGVQEALLFLDSKLP